MESKQQWSVEETVSLQFGLPLKCKKKTQDMVAKYKASV